jgi:hypothetical protein
VGAVIEGPSREGFFLYPAYRNSGDGEGYGSGDQRPHIYPDGRSHAWSLDYTPGAAGGAGRITVRLDAQETVLTLAAGHRAPGAYLDRFGIVTTWIDGNDQRVYLDDLTYTWRQQWRGRSELPPVTVGHPS